MRAMAALLTNHVWTVPELIRVVIPEGEEAKSSWRMRQRGTIAGMKQRKNRVQHGWFRRHRFLILAVILVSYALVYTGLVGKLHFGDRINEANFYRLKRGMTEKEVEGILGSTDKDWGAGVKTWTSTNVDLVIIVDYDEAARVKDATLLSVDAGSNRVTSRPLP
jgi:hypothetical protein